MRAIPIPLWRIVAIALSAFVVLQAYAATPAPAYQVIVDRNSAVTTVDRRFLADAFLKKVTTWPDGSAIRPADLPPSSPVRRRFSEDVLRRSVEAVKGYWQQRIFSGRDVPPPELDTDEAMVDYVLKHQGAVGYVSGAANVDGLKVLSVN
jgi:hypothetical protein